jgi:hypothetical protein
MSVQDHSATPDSSGDLSGPGVSLPCGNSELTAAARAVAREVVTATTAQAGAAGQLEEGLHSHAQHIADATETVRLAAQQQARLAAETATAVAEALTAGPSSPASLVEATLLVSAAKQAAAAALDAHALVTAASELSVHAAESAAAFEFDMVQTVVAAQDLAAARLPAHL